MKLSSTARSSSFEDKSFLLLLLLVSVAFFWVLRPFFGAVFWAAVLAIIFSPVYQRLLRALRGKRVLAALLTLLAVIVLVILPVGIITALLIQEAGTVYQRMQSGELSVARYFQQIYDVLPAWVTGLLDRFGMNNFSLVQQRIIDSLTRGGQFFAAQALNIGQNTFNFLVSFFVMLYLLFFLLLDGAALSARIREAVPMDAEIKRRLMARFTTVTRATVKGNIVVAALQGALGGLIFWLLDVRAPVLWGTVMAFLSLLPAVGAALVWLPVAIYFLVTGNTGSGLVLIVFGVLVIGLVDNLLRPVLVGKDTKMPDYVVLVSTVGGMVLFGPNGFVIGPLVAAMFMAAWGIVARARQPDTPEPPRVQDSLPGAGQSRAAR